MHGRHTKRAALTVSGSALNTVRLCQKAIMKGEKAEPVISIEDIEVKDPDQSKWESFCGKYEHPGLTIRMDAHR